MNSFASTRLARFSISNVLPSISARVSLDPLLVLWFATTPLFSFHLRFPEERSVITYDRAVFLLVAVMLLMKWRRQAAPHAIGLQPPGILVATRFEVAWGVLALLALLSALVEANNLGYATKIAVDSFCLPLLAFHVAHHYFDASKRAGSLALSTIWLTYFLFGTGAIEFVTGVNLFPYKGSELFREGELRVNGPFSSDSSYAITSLLFVLFLLAMPRLLRLRFDAGGHLVYAGAIATGVIATLLPLFRSVAVALLVCWAIVEIGLAKHRASERRTSDHESKDVPASSFANLMVGSSARTRLIVLAVVGLALVVGESMSGSSRVGSRLVDPRNAYGRLATWQAATEVALNNPLFGVGLTNYGDYYHQKYNWEGESEESFLDTRAADSPHSNPLWIMAEFGMIGFVLYLAANVYLLLMGFRALKSATGERKRAAAFCFLALVLAYWIPGLTLTSGGYSDLNLYYFFLLGLLSNRSLVTGS